MQSVQSAKLVLRWFSLEAWYFASNLPTRTITFRSKLNVLMARWHTHADFAFLQAGYAEMLAAEASRFTNSLPGARRQPKSAQYWEWHLYNAARRKTWRPPLIGLNWPLISLILAPLRQAMKEVKGG